MEPDLTALPPDIQAVLWSLAFDIGIVAVAVVALLTTIKHVGAIIDRASGHCLDRPYVQIGLEVAPLILGPAIALVPGLFDTFGIELQAVFGLISGYMSPGIYGHLKNRLPGLMVSKTAPSRSGDSDE